MKFKFKNITVWLLVALAVVSLYTLTLESAETSTEVGYTEFISYAENAELTTVTLQPDQSDSYYLTGVLNSGTTITSIAPFDPTLITYFEDKGITVNLLAAEEASILASLLVSFLPLIIVLFILMWFMNKSQGGGNNVMQFGKSKAKLNTDEKNKVTFVDVAGVEEVKEELEEIVDFLKAPQKYTQLGAKIPKGVLLFGPPGTGKTLLARAVAGEAGVPFFTISGSDFVEMFVGVGASRVRDLFETAKKQAPCIVFIDEIDAVGRQRGAGLGGGHDEREQTLNQLLVEMDGFAANEGIIVIAATNRPDVLDPALLRPGRFDRQVTVDAPDVLGREKVLEVHAKDKPIEEGIDFSVVAKRTPGFTGADLANTLNEAALLAARRDKKVITMNEIEDAVERVIAGPEKKSKVISPKEKRLVCYHEAGHAVVAYYLDNSDPLHKISIIPRGMAGGYTLLLPEEDRNYNTKKEMLDNIVMFLGGRVAEELVLGDVSTGAQNDIERATELIRQMITRYGMSEKLGPMAFGKAQGQVFLGRDFSQERNYSEEVAFEIDMEARKMMDEAHDRARQILSDNIDKLHAVAAVLDKQETICAEEFYPIMKDEVVNETAETVVENSLNSMSEAQVIADEMKQL